MALVVLFFVLSFMAIGGTYLNINPYDNLIWIKTIAHFIFLALTMMIIPFCYKKFSPKANAKNGRSICKWNCLIVLSFYFVIDVFLMSGIYDETFQNLGANLVYTLMFYYINCKLFFNKNNVTEETIPCNREKEHIENTQKTLDLDTDKTTPQEAAEYLFAEQLGEQYTPQKDTKPTKAQKNKFCSQCGALIDSETKKCTGCGKQYFRGLRFTKFSVTVTILALILTALSTVCVLQYSNSQTLESSTQAEINKLESKIISLEQQVKSKQSTIAQLKNEIDGLESDLENYKDIALFIDEYVVFVEDDGTDYYHKYECYKFKGNYFWSYNVEKAVQLGYSACPNCH